MNLLGVFVLCTVIFWVGYYYGWHDAQTEVDRILDRIIEICIDIIESVDPEEAQNLREEFSQAAKK